MIASGYIEQTKNLLKLHKADYFGKLKAVYVLR